MGQPSAHPSAGHRIPVLEKAIGVIEAIASGTAGQGSAALARATGASQSTVYRILKTLERADWIRLRDDGGHALGAGLLGLVCEHDDLARIAALAQPQLDALARDFQVTAKLSVRQGQEQLTLAVGQPRVPIAILAPVGVPFPVVHAASGAALLSGLDADELETLISRTPAEHWHHEQPDALRRRVAACQSDGWCANLGVHPQGIDALAAPVRAGPLPLALSLIGHRGDFREEVLPHQSRRLRNAARGLAVQL